MFGNKNEKEKEEVTKSMASVKNLHLISAVGFKGECYFVQWSEFRNSYHLLMVSSYSIRDVRLKRTQPTHITLSRGSITTTTTCIWG